MSCHNCGRECPNDLHTNEYGVQVCEACWTDYVSLPYNRLVSRAKYPPIPQHPPGSQPTEANAPTPQPAQAGERLSISSRRVRGGMLRNGGVPPRRPRNPFAEAAKKLDERSINSICLICGRIAYHQRTEKCKVCRGLCRYMSDEDMGLVKKWQGRGERSVL